MESAAAGKHHTHHRGVEKTAAHTSSVNAADDGLAVVADRHHHIHGEGHNRHGRGFGFGHFVTGMGNYIQEQMRAARREIAGEHIGEAVSGLAQKVSELIDGSGRQAELAGALETFNSAIQDVAARLENGEIGQRRAMAGFRAAYENLVEGMRPAPADGITSVELEVSAVADAAGFDEQPAVNGEAGVAGDDTLVAGLGQAFNAFMQELRSGPAMLDGMRPFMSAENRDRVIETFVDLYRELAGPDGGTVDPDPESGEVNQLA